jgi:hypothetical protein
MEFWKTAKNGYFRAWGVGGRRFKSSHPDQLNQRVAIFYRSLVSQKPTFVANLLPFLWHWQECATSISYSSILRF